MDTLGERERHNQRQFDGLAASYDRMGFLALTAQFLAGAVKVQPGDAVLDVMTGTGHVALALAGAVGPSGRVVGADLSAGMLEVARAKAAGLEQLSFVQGDACSLPFADASFGAVVCASGLFFVPDMVAALREWRRLVRPGGEVVFSSFGPGLMGDLPGRWRERLGQYGVTPGSPPLGRIPTPEAAQELLQSAGFAQIRVSLSALPYTLASPQARWADIEAGLEGQPLATFTPSQQARIQAEHRADIAPLFASGPYTVPVPVLVARGVRGD
ncbi:class I SAM-dependent methyltransferase [Deinococcus koreensis]|uniref:Methyltransferase n=1 Tax=Deinococcus koreensis TaxID=2054903 RepID=A0A2K3UZ60_9DEIO|nr:methyltransferase domain-containing protein [Deinococcus koreensis]PNY81811.1 methyltransferase [Deinococcus koreensis]